MKYYLIAGEASGDLHASRLMAALKEKDADAQFRFIGGDLMQAQGGTLVRHYKDMAYMGLIPVLLHLRTILKNMSLCKKDVAAWKPDVLVLIDYPGFNLDIAKYIHSRGICPVYYYISPKIWAWKEYRIKNIKRDVDEMLCILPFEVDFYKRHDYPVCYVGNPTLDEVDKFEKEQAGGSDTFATQNGLSGKPVIALLAGSRKQEIKNNLGRMIQAASAFPDYEMVVAGAPGIENSFYDEVMKGNQAKVVTGQTYQLLQHAVAALVTSGTATLETALFRVPQVVCYRTLFPRTVAFLRKCLLHVKYISLVNLVADKEVVKELVAHQMTAEATRAELQKILCDKDYRQAMLDGYEEVARRLGTPGAPQKAAEIIIGKLTTGTGK